MLSKKQMRWLIRAVYDASDEYGREIERLYRRANRQIKGEISTFLSSKANWSGKVSKDDLEDVRAELEESNDDTVSSLCSALLASVTLGHPKQGDVETARLALPLIRVAKIQHRQIYQLSQEVPSQIVAASYQQNRVTPKVHRLPINYDVMLQRQVSDSVRQNVQDTTNINRNIQQSISRIRDIAQQASQANDASNDWAKQVDRVLTGGKAHGGASARAKMIVRTQACHELNKGTIEDFRARGVKQYRFMSLESRNSCRECNHLDGNVYEVADAEEGVNLPPMHPNCQCWIIEYHSTDFGTGSSLPITKDS